MLREIWRPPRLQNEVNDELEHRATWLELFYDVAYVATIYQLESVFSEDTTLSGLLRFVMLFIPIWWSWSGITFYMNRFIVDDFLHRVFIFVQISAIAVVAISVSEAFGKLATQFVLAYILIRCVLIVLYYRAGRHNPQVRPLTNSYVWGYVVGALIWGASLFTSEPLQVVLWGVGMLAELLVPFLPGIRRRQKAFPADPPHLAERYGLFTIIVLGESFVKVIGQASGAELGVSQIIFSAFGLTAVFALWWLYFGDVAVSSLKDSVWAMYAWTYAHFPVAVGITLFSVAATRLFFAPLDAPLLTEDRLLYGGALTLTLAALGVIDAMTERDDQSLPSRQRAGIRLMAAAILLVITLLGEALRLWVFTGAMALVFVLQVVIDILAARWLGRAKAKPDAQTPAPVG